MNSKLASEAAVEVSVAVKDKEATTSEAAAVVSAVAKEEMEANSEVTAADLDPTIVTLLTEVEREEVVVVVLPEVVPLLPLLPSEFFLCSEPFEI